MIFRPAFTTTASIGLLVAVATLPLRNVFGEWTWTIAVIGAAVGGAAVASLLETVRKDMPLPAVVIITALAAAIWALIVPLRTVLFADPISFSIFEALRDGIFDGWGALLEEQHPLSDPRGAETFVSVLAWFAAATAVHVAARRRSALGAVATSAVVLWIATAAALQHGLSPTAFGAGAGIMALFAISTVARAPDQRWRFGRFVSLVGVIGLAGGAAFVAGTASTSLDREPFDPRASRNTEIIGFEVPDVLAEFGVRRAEDRVVMSVESVSLPPALRLRLQVYEVHDGAQWLPATEFEQFATFPEPEILPPGDEVVLEISIDDLDGPWIPLPDRSIRVDLSDVRWSDETQTGLRVDAAGYKVTGSVVSRTDIEGLQSARDEVPERLSEVPAGFPESIRGAAELATSDTTDALESIDAITARLRQLERHEPVTPGHSFARLSDDLAGGRATGAEQIASLHALMLRAAGIPSRLVVGYVVTGPAVQASDLHVWTEAAFPGIGWVAFDPVPTITDGGPNIEENSTVTTTTVSSANALEARALPSELGPGEDPGEPEIGVDEDVTLTDAIVVMGSGILLLLAVMVTARLIRRRFRRSSGGRAEVRVLGAWAELVDRLRELGAPIAGTTTIEDVVYMATEMDDALGGEVRLVADLAAIALHSPDGSTPEDATLAWEHLGMVESRFAEVRGRRTIALRYLDPRVLRFRSPRPPPSRDGGHRGGPTTVV